MICYLRQNSTVRNVLEGKLICCENCTADILYVGYLSKRNSQYISSLNATYQDPLHHKLDVFKEFIYIFILFTYNLNVAM